MHFLYYIQRGYAFFIAKLCFGPISSEKSTHTNAGIGDYVTQQAKTQYPVTIQISKLYLIMDYRRPSFLRTFYLQICLFAFQNWSKMATF